MPSQRHRSHAGMTLQAANRFALRGDAPSSPTASHVRLTWRRHTGLAECSLRCEKPTGSRAERLLEHRDEGAGARVAHFQRDLRDRRSATEQDERLLQAGLLPPATERHPRFANEHALERALTRAGAAGEHRMLASARPAPRSAVARARARVSVGMGSARGTGVTTKSRSRMSPANRAWCGTRSSSLPSFALTTSSSRKSGDTSITRGSVNTVFVRGRK